MLKLKMYNVLCLLTENCVFAKVDFLAWKLLLQQVSNVTSSASVSCASRFQIIWISVVYIYKAALLAVGLYFTWNTRQVR